jgi:hypothetical protein
MPFPEHSSQGISFWARSFFTFFKLFPALLFESKPPPAMAQTAAAVPATTIASVMKAEAPRGSADIYQSICTRTQGLYPKLKKFRQECNAKLANVAVGVT